MLKLITKAKNLEMVEIKIESNKSNIIEHIASISYLIDSIIENQNISEKKVFELIKEYRKNAITEERKEN